MNETQLGTKKDKFHIAIGTIIAVVILVAVFGGAYFLGKTIFDQEKRLDAAEQGIKNMDKVLVEIVNYVNAEIQANQNK